MLEEEEEEAPPLPLEVAIEEALNKASKGDMQEALASLEGVEGTSPIFAQLARSTILLAQAQQEGPEREQARRRAWSTLEKLKSVDREAIEPRLALAQLAQDAGDASATYRFYLEAVELALSKLTAEVESVRQYFEARGSEGLAPFVRELNRHLPLIGQLTATSGDLAFKRGEDDKAFLSLYRAHLQEPSNRPLALLLARVAHSVGKSTLSRQLLLHLMEAKDVSPEVVERAKALLKKV